VKTSWGKLWKWSMKIAIPRKQKLMRLNQPTQSRSLDFHEMNFVAKEKVITGKTAR
jgi:hypothetical protein